MNGAEDAFPARLAYQLAQDRVVNAVPRRELVISGLRDRGHGRTTSGLNQEHERRVLEVHGA
jgi:hypothetical protein